MKYDVLYNFISPITGRILCDPGHVLVGDKNGIAVPSLTPFPSSQATYILQVVDPALPNAQALGPLGGGILKSAADTGVVSIALGGTNVATDDYVTPLNLFTEVQLLEAQIAEVLVAATEAGAIAGAIAGAVAAQEIIDNLEITLEGDIIGHGNVNKPIITTFTLTLNEIPNAGDVDIAGYALKNLAEFPEDELDAVSFEFLWKLLNDEIV